MRLYTKLITEDNVDLLIGPYSSGITQAVAPLVNKYEKVMIEPEASLPDIYVAGNMWNIQGIASSLGYLEGVLPLAKDGAKTVPCSRSNRPTRWPATRPASNRRRLSTSRSCTRRPMRCPSPISPPSRSR